VALLSVITSVNGVTERKDQAQADGIIVTDIYHNTSDI
jgi:hypothetical protein